MPVETLVPHTDIEMEDLAQSASELAPVPAPMVKNSSTTRKKLKLRVTPVVQDSARAAQDPMVEVTNNPTLVSNRQESESLARHLCMFKQDRRKRRKAQPSQNPARKFRNMDARAMRIHWRTKKKAPSTEVVQTPVTALLRMVTSCDGSISRKSIPFILRIFSFF